MNIALLRGVDMMVMVIKNNLLRLDWMYTLRVDCPSLSIVVVDLVLATICYCFVLMAFIRQILGLNNCLILSDVIKG